MKSQPIFKIYIKFFPERKNKRKKAKARALSAFAFMKKNKRFS